MTIVNWERRSTALQEVQFRLQFARKLMMHSVLQIKCLVNWQISC